MASLRHEMGNSCWKHICGATIIGQRKLITTAYSIITRPNGKPMKVIIGQTISFLTNIGK